MLKNYKILSRVLLMWVVIATTLSCKTVLYRHPETVFPRIEISEGGGFTGALSIYQVLDNGQVFFRDMGDTTFQEVNRVSKKEAREIFALVRQKVVAEETINEPDNIYRSISYLTSEGTATSTWYRNRSELDEVYNTILTKINNQNVVR
jgi:hypothetical protein